MSDLLDELRELGMQQEAYERNVVNLIASDNAYPRFLAVLAPYRGNMIQEGRLGERPFAGASLHDSVERLASNVACTIFSADHANVQPHSCSQANQSVYHALLREGDHAVALDLRSGGHLTHGMKSNFSGRLYRFSFYSADGCGYIDYESLEMMARNVRPRLIICGSSSYPRLFDAPRLRSIADEVGAKLMFDLSHEAGLIAAGAIPNPVPFADVVTMSLDKTLRGPFGGLILCKEELATCIDQAVHPGTQSSFSIRKVFDAAHALLCTQDERFISYAKNVLGNAKVLETHFKQFTDSMLTGGTDKHYIVLDVHHVFGITGVVAERILERIGILSNRQTLPRDASMRMALAGGLRLGSPWATSRGYLADDFEEIAAIIAEALSSQADGTRGVRLAARVSDLSRRERFGDVWLPT